MNTRKLIKTDQGYTLEGVTPQLALKRNDSGWVVTFRDSLAVSRPGAYSMFKLRRNAETLANFIADTLSNERLESFSYGTPTDVHPTADERQAIIDETRRLQELEELRTAA